ncbi:putative DNA/RNA helicase, superfamily II [Megalodesulfovibrio gigas DSM 1382 = ATCC 19364]|uniref:Putative DNA/RNA helicase, superfamily II n=2 Tax=Megalodesulfovibrio gigas TaxID=879 RepID=T2GD00_MEGG1|nr:putative DNA/RNA helicase, superfamily II [Megalodesulfovibrio gigas DSM 1382 = ATCC 19364]
MALDFAAINAAALAACPEILKGWLPGGEKQGKNYVCGDLAGSPGHSLSVHLEKGFWKDFGTGEGGGDLISLYAAIYQLSQGAAAKALARELGQGGSRGAGRTPRPVATGSVTGASTGEAAAQVCVLSLVPDAAPRPPDSHPRHGRCSMAWEYRDQLGRLLGRVLRFDTAQGKQIVPQVFCEVENRAPRWQWKSWPAPRPL